MDNRHNATWISLRLADGEYFPIFHRGDPDTGNLSLIPARVGQDEADLSFYFHPAGGLAPISLGELRFPNLPGDPAEAELKLDAVLGPAGLLTLTVSHPASGRIERLELTLPEDSNRSDSASGEPRVIRLRRTRWILGALFVAAGLALVFYITLLVARWGEQPAVPAPLSRLVANGFIRLG